MSVKIAIPGHLQQLTGGADEVTAEGNDVSQCLHQLVAKYPALHDRIFNRKGNLLDYIVIFLNGEDTYPEELAKPVNSGDKLQIIYMVGGG
jgi:molybdopterin converting factor small subunit